VVVVDVVVVVVVVVVSNDDSDVSEDDGPDIPNQFVDVDGKMVREREKAVPSASTSTCHDTIISRDITTDDNDETQACVVEDDETTEDSWRHVPVVEQLLVVPYFPTSRHKPPVIIRLNHG
jgi:hypothetical protein